MIITGENKPLGKTPNTWDELLPTEGPAGEVIEATSEEQLAGRIAANQSEYNDTVRTLIWLTKKQEKEGDADKNADLFDTALAMQNMLLRGTFETSESSAQLAVNGTVLHSEDFDKYWVDAKLLSEGITDEMRAEAAEIELQDGEEDIKAIKQFSEDVCEIVTSENVRAARGHETGYLFHLQELLMNAMEHCSLEGLSRVKEEYYDSLAQIQDHFIEMAHERDRQKAQSLGHASVQIAGKTETIGDK